MSILASLTPPKGLRVLITAGAGGIGKCIADGFVETGARVHISDINAAALDAAIGGAITGTRANSADPKDTERLFSEALDHLGGLDVVIANAGIAGPTATVDAITPDEWDETLEINLKGAYLAAHHARLELVKSKGQFIAISSVAGRLPYAFRTPYAASKWGVVGLAKSLAAELGPDGVRANAILPGIVEGPRIDGVISARAKQTGVSFEEMRETYLGKVSLRRMVSPKDIAAMCLFLSSAGGANISGQALSVCGGVETL
ncbi:MAG: SDR family oxidoreductase [Rhodobacteraceae bacterium]|jgi:NAD(P)-dependent dehydrogenase (short-subunit alcohol dehydrogenase family)|uniref:SDR family oxidoreductase n=1 Tax=Roseovarius sp. 10 TaxID=3080563 RepID=UPI001937D2BB|nr:SDR family oxidoreductase [Roseovarius sp. 10]MBE1290569.1 SDR family oxidoreductase [Paracoccaceae bacterium]MDV7201339.1 SDR family oxidoreductase [Roseovarius sp. 10]QPI86424.1 SDR family oxidoreductase [Rhodobacterales bacterium HKCCA1288]